MIFFITGGSSGIGAAIVRRAIETGHEVAFTYRTNGQAAAKIVDLTRQQHPDAKIRAYALDVQNPDQVEQVANQVLDDFETVHVVINNAGISRDNLVAMMSNEEWNEVIATNLTGPFYVCRQFLPVLLANKFGRIINIGSVASGGMSGMANYAAAKAGLVGFTQSLAKEYGRRNITANVVSPGIFETGMTDAHLTSRTRDFWAKFCPVPDGKPGNIEELADIIVYLASERVSYINGEEIHVSGGLNWGP